MMKYRVVGPRTVAGVAPGGVLELDETRLNVAALVQAGHVRLVAEEPDEAQVVPLDELTVPELRSYAEQQGIDLGEARLKADIVAAIRAGASEEVEQ